MNQNGKASCRHGKSFQADGKKWIFTVLLTTILLLMASLAGRAMVVSSGFLKVTTFSGGKPYRPECSTNEIRAVIDSNGRWALEVRPLHPVGDMLHGKTDIIYLTFDGTNNYYCQYSEAIEGIKQGQPGIIGTTAITNQAQTGYISPGSFPFSPYDIQKRTQVLWLMYGAGQYIHDERLETMPLPWLTARYRLDAYGFRLKYDLSLNLPYIPITLEFVRDSHLDLSDEQSEYTRPELDVDTIWFERLKNDLNLRKTKWQEGATAGVLKTLAFTNLDNFRLPLASEFRLFMPNGDLLRLFELIVTNVAGSAAAETLTPPVLADVFVFDSRFRVRESSKVLDSINYHLTPGQSWESTNAASLQKLFHAYLNTPQLTAIHKLSNSPEQRPMIIIYALVAVTVVPLLLWLRFVWKHRKIPKA